MRLYILADDPLARAGLAASLASQPGVSIVGQREPGRALDAEVRALQPDALVWDLGWAPRPDAAAWLRERTALPALVPILALLPDEQMAAEIWSAGIRGLARRDAPPEELLAALQALTHGLAVVDPELAQALLPPRESPPEALAEPLTPRESEVLQLLADGLSNKAIARALGISEHTVKFHVNAIMNKLDASSRTDAVVRATRLGLVIL